MKRVFTVVLIGAAGIASGCATSEQINVIRSVDFRPPERKREAALVIPQFIGRYRVRDVSGEYRPFKIADFVLSAGVPTLQLRTSNFGAVLFELQANECSGDVVNKNSESMYLVCFGASPNALGAPSFSISKIDTPREVPAGLFQRSLTVSDGYVITYTRTIGRQIIARLSVAKDEVAK